MKKLRLSNRSKKQLLNKEMKEINGGSVHLCTCGCVGPSNREANGWANSDDGLSSPGGGIDFVHFDEWMVEEYVRK